MMQTWMLAAFIAAVIIIGALLRIAAWVVRRFVKAFANNNRRERIEPWA